MPRRRRRRAKAVAVEPEDERGFVMRMLLHSPKDLIAGGLAAAAVSAIIANALFLQAGRPSHRRRPARTDRIWLRPVEADRHHRRRHSVCDLEIRARSQASGDRADVRPSGEGARGDDRASDRLTLVTRRGLRWLAAITPSSVNPTRRVT